MPYENEHSCRLKSPDSLKGADRVARVKQKDGSVLITGFWGTKTNPTKALTQAKRYPTNRFSKEQAQKDCQRLGGKFEPAK